MILLSLKESFCSWPVGQPSKTDHEQPVGQEECYQRFNFFSENAGFFLVATGLTSRSCDRFQERMKRSDAWSWGPWGQEDVFVHEWKAAAKKRIIKKNSSFSMNDSYVFKWFPLDIFHFILLFLINKRKWKRKSFVTVDKTWLIIMLAVISFILFLFSWPPTYQPESFCG